jgi:hypothetical protein
MEVLTPATAVANLTRHLVRWSLVSVSVWLERGGFVSLSACWWYVRWTSRAPLVSSISTWPGSHQQPQAATGQAFQLQCLLVWFAFTCSQATKERKDVWLYSFTWNLISFAGSQAAPFVLHRWGLTGPSQTARWPDTRKLLKTRQARPGQIHSLAFLKIMAIVQWGSMIFSPMAVWR